jgi:hypothetical protein
MYFDDRWVFFTITINWDSPKGEDPKTVAAFEAAASKASNIVYEGLRA